MTGGQEDYSEQKNNRKTFGNWDFEDVDWSSKDLKKIKKNFYTEHEDVTNRKQSEIDTWKEENRVTMKGEDIPRPVFDFAEAPFPEEIVELLQKSFKKPTVVQSISWPIALTGRDIISIAKTGSGKTLGFLLPAIVHTKKQKHKPQKGDGPAIVVILPTRELAQQVDQVSKDFCNALGMRMACVYGGTKDFDQAKDVKRGVDILVATPGRLLDFMSRGVVTMERCTFLVLDEADRMLDMGFEPQIRKIISQIRPDRQTLMFSATWPDSVQQLAKDFQNDAAFLNVGSLDLAANHSITQHVELVKEEEKDGKLKALLNKLCKKGQPVPRMIVFVLRKKDCDRVFNNICRMGYQAECIHGDKKQFQREEAIAAFKKGKTNMLLATDVAARGLDVDDVKFVINYDYPLVTEDYVHRIGRTGRRDKTGTAYTFFTFNDRQHAYGLVKILEEANQEVTPELKDLAMKNAAPRNNKGIYGAGFSAPKRSMGADGEAVKPKHKKFDDDSD